MMKRSLAFWALTAAAVFAVLVAWWIIIAPPPTSSADYASWGQAAGSVLAIVAAIGLAVFQQNRIAAERRDEEKSKHVALARATALASAYINSSLTLADQRQSNASWTRGMPRVVLADLEAGAETLKGIPLGEIPSPEAAIAALNLVQVAHASAVFLRIVDADVDGGRQVASPYFGEMSTKGQEAAARLREALQAEGLMD